MNSEGMAEVVQVRIAPSRVRYIKLGGGGRWETECLEKGIIRIGFGAARPDRLRFCQSKDWKRLAKSFIAEGKNKATATRSARELRVFFDDDGTTLWITFMRGASTGACLTARHRKPTRAVTVSGVQ